MALSRSAPTVDEDRGRLPGKAFGEHNCVGCRIGLFKLRASARARLGTIRQPPAQPRCRQRRKQGSVAANEAKEGEIEYDTSTHGINRTVQSGAIMSVASDHTLLTCLAVLADTDWRVEHYSVFTRHRRLVTPAREWVLVATKRRTQRARRNVEHYGEVGHTAKANGGSLKIASRIFRPRKRTKKRLLA